MIGLSGQLLYYSANMAAGISFLFGQYLPRCDHRIDKLFDYHVIQLLDGGSIDLRLGSAEYHLEGRWFWSSYPGPRIKFHPTDPAKTWVHRYLAFAGPGVEQWKREGIFPIAPQAVFRQEHFPQQFDELLALSRRGDRIGNHRAALLLESMLTELADLRSSAQSVPQWLDPVLSRMQQLGERFNQDQLANEAGMSPRSFLRRFSAAMGVSPSEYVIRQRIAHAREMLGRTQLPIKTIASQLGYSDVAFFTRQFRASTGVTPAAFRKSREG